MRAVVYERYGAPDVLHIADVERPAPGPNEVLVRVRAVTVSRTDCGFRGGKPAIMRIATGVRTPRLRILGSDFAGDVVELGSDVSDYAVGDRVFGTRFGAHAELVRVRERGVIAHLPDGLSYEEGAAVCDGALKALVCLRSAGPLDGARIAVYGASGAIGTAAVQLAKHFGAHVTAICNGRNVDLVRSLGADHVVDYTKETFTAGRERYDVILDNVGSQDFSDMADVMQPDGVIVVVGGSKKGPFLGPIKRVAWSRLAQPFLAPRIKFYLARVNKADLELLAQFAREGKLRSVIDRRYPLEQTGAALEYLGQGHARGKIVIDVE